MPTFHIQKGDKHYQVEAADREAAIAKVQGTQGGGAVDTLARNVGEPFNRGLLSMIQAPTDLINFGMRVIGDNPMHRGKKQWDTPQIPADMLGFGERMGMVAPEAERKTGLVPRAAELLGGSVIPAGATMKAAGAASQVLPTARNTAQAILAPAAARPGAMVAGDVASSFTAALGGETAQRFTDDPTMIALAELGGGFIPGLVAVSPAVKLGKRAGSFAAQTVLPFTRKGAEPRAARRLQKLVSDPKAAAAKIGTAPEFSPARQTGEQSLLALERRVLLDDPKQVQQYTDELNQARLQLQEEGRSFGGDKHRPRLLLEQHRDYLLNLVRVRAAEAAQNAQAEAVKLGPNASSRDVSRVARTQLESALGDARKTEAQLWSSLDQEAPAELKQAQALLQGELSRRGKYADPNDVPAYLRAILDEAEIPEPLLAQLSRAGLLDEQGQVPPAVRKGLEEQGLIQPKALTFRDVQDLRSRVLASLREERAKPGYSRNKVRILSGVEEALLDDLAATGVKGVNEARAFSRELNDKFTRGEIGKLLGYERSGSDKVSGANTLRKIVYSQDAAESIDQFIQASPQSAQQLDDYVRAQYVESVYARGAFDARAHDRFMDNLRSRGVFERMPGLEQDLLRSRLSQEQAGRLDLRADKVNKLAQDSGRSRAALFLNADPGDEMRAVINSRNPVAQARSLVRRMGNDPLARNGLKELFMEELFQQSAKKFDDAGNRIVDANTLKGLMRENRDVMFAFGVKEDDLKRMADISRRLQLAELQPNIQIKEVVEDTPAAVVDLLARYLGAQYGGRMGDTAGAQLQMAQTFAARMRKAVERLTKGKAEELLIAAQFDPVLYKHLLTRATDSPKQQTAAARALEPYLVGATAIQQGTEE